MMETRYVVDAATSKGRYHKENEDSCVSNERFIVVADGMGGESDGNMASEIAVSVISRMLEEGLQENLSGGEIRQLSMESVRKADDGIMDYISSNPDSFGMGTTVVIAVLEGRHLYVTWCGDSRCYVYSRDKGIRSLTKDHSYVQELIDSGDITVEESYTHPDSNIITRFVGGGEDACVPDFVSCELDDEDIVIVCSDGLSGYCMDRDIEDAVAEASGNEGLSACLLDLALKHGSDDDITVVTVMSEKCRIPSGSTVFGWFRRKRHQKISSSGN